MTKKQKKAELRRVPTVRQLSKWQRQQKIRRIIIIGAAVFLGGILGFVGYGYYKDEIKSFRETVIKVNEVSFNMGYYVNMLDVRTRGMEAAYIDYFAGIVARYIEDSEVVRQRAEALGIVVNKEEVNKVIEDKGFPNDRVYRDMVEAELLREMLLERFASGLPDAMEQAHVQVVLVESQEVADDVMARIESGEDFIALVDEFSCAPKIEGDLGWLPRELMPNSIIGDAAFSLESGQVHRRIYDDSATKSVGYWLIEVTDKDEEKGIEARVILLGSKADAQEIKTKLADEDFTALAKEYSQHGSKDEGGELGWLRKGDMGSKAFEDVAFKLPPGEVSEPIKDESVQTKGGYWIIEVLDRGEYELSEEVRKKLAQNEFGEWFQVQRETSIIDNHLDEEKTLWAVEQVLAGR